MICSSIGEIHLQEPRFEKIQSHPIQKIIQKKLNCVGTLNCTADNYIYLKIQDEFITLLFPFIQNTEVMMPPYFNEKLSLGAHVSVIYSDENKKEGVSVQNLITAFLNKKKMIPFVTHSFFKATIQNKTYFAIEIQSDELEELRMQFGLNPKQLCFKGVWVPFHFTIGIYKNA